MGGLCESSSTPAVTSHNSTTSTGLPEWVSQGGQDIFENAKTLANREYPTYGGPRVAGTTADQETGYASVRANQGAFQPYGDKAGAALGNASEMWSGDVADRYMNPYQERVLDIAAGKMRENDDISRKGRNARAVQMGAFGGAQHGVVEASAADDLTENIGEMYARGMGAGYDSAYGKFSGDRGAALSGAAGYSSLGQLDSSMGYADADMMTRIGQAQQGHDQANLDTAYGDFLEQREWPYRQTNFVLGALQGVPYETTQTSTGTGTTPIASPSVMGQVAGLGIGAAGLYNLWK